MDPLQKRHAFDQLEMWLSTIKNNFIDGLEDDIDERIDELNDQIADLEEELNSKENVIDDLKMENDSLMEQIKNVKAILSDVSDHECGADYILEQVNKALDIL